MTAREVIEELWLLEKDRQRSNATGLFWKAADCRTAMADLFCKHADAITKAAKRGCEGKKK